MKTKIPAIAAFTLALSLVPLGAQTTLPGDHVVTGDLTVEQTLSVEGNAIDFGTTSSTNAAVALQYSEVGTNATVVVTATEPEAGFLWRDNALGTLVPKMFLDGTNTLSLYLPDGSAVGIFLDPAGESTFAGSVTLSGTNNLMPNQMLTGDDSVLTRTLADGRYLSAGATTLAIGGTNFVVSTNGRVGVGTATPSYDISLNGQSNRTFSVEQISTGSGKNLTISAGAGALEANRSGGSLILSAGASTGIGNSEILFQTAQEGTNGSSALNSMLTRMRINRWGAVGIGTGSLSGSYWGPGGGLDISYGGIPGTLLLGADVNSTARTDYTSKGMAITMPHYRATEKPVSVLRGWNHSGANELYMGGGGATYLATTKLIFYTGENNVTLGGHPRFSIHANGKIIANESNIATADFQVKGAQEDNLLYIAAATNRVGIGTNAPAATLHVAGNTQVDGTLDLPNQTITNSSSAITVGQADARYLPAAALASTNHVTFGSLSVDDGELTLANRTITGTGLSMSFEDGAVEGRMVFQGTSIPSLDAAAKINFRDELEVGATNDVTFGALTVGTITSSSVTANSHLQAPEIRESTGLRVIDLENSSLTRGTNYVAEWTATNFILSRPLVFGGTNAALWRAQTRTNLELGPTNNVTFARVTTDYVFVHAGFEGTALGGSAVLTVEADDTNVTTPIFNFDGDAAEELRARARADLGFVLPALTTSTGNDFLRELGADGFGINEDDLTYVHGLYDHANGYVALHIHDEGFHWGSTNLPANLRASLGLGPTNDVVFKSLKLSNVGTNLVFGETGSIVLESTEAPSSLSLKVHGITYLTAFQGTGVVFGVPVSFGTNAPAARASLELGPFATATNLVATNISDFAGAAAAAVPPTTNAGDLTTGILPDERLSTNVVGSYVRESPFGNVRQLTIGKPSPTNWIEAGDLVVSNYFGSAIPLRQALIAAHTTNATSLTAGTLPDARLSTNVMFRTNNLADLTNVGQARTNLQMGVTNNVRFGGLEAAYVEGTQMVFIGDGGVLRFETPNATFTIPEAFSVLADDGFMEIGLPVYFFNGADGAWRDALGLGPLATATNIPATNISGVMAIANGGTGATNAAAAVGALQLDGDHTSSGTVVTRAKTLWDEANDEWGLYHCDHDFWFSTTQRRDNFRAALGLGATQEVTFGALTVGTNDRVGIGTNAPAETFHVAGNARIDGALRIAPQGDLAMGVYTNQP